MRISDWSSDVCSSDLHRVGHRAAEAFAFDGEHALRVRRLQRRGVETDAGAADRRVGAATKPQRQVDRLLDAWQHEIRIAQYALAAVLVADDDDVRLAAVQQRQRHAGRSEEHTSELQSLMRISYAVFCLKTKNNKVNHSTTIN